MRFGLGLAKPDRAVIKGGRGCCDIDIARLAGNALAKPLNILDGVRHSESLAVLVERGE